ncbi:LysR substrate-binding domain-containing protein, partial [Sweet potato little leaf phytoplasma]|uniref:LysR substrate-binding domain-containing protein n=1 Tax=Candidatus Phytoplasma australasiaticum TaxID=2754999 RepID=UPI0030EA855F
TDEVWICRSDGHEITELLHRASSELNFTPRIAIAANDYQETQAMVAAGLGIALAPKLSTTTCRTDITALQLNKNVPGRHLHLVHSGSRASPAVENMIIILKELLT